MQQTSSLSLFMQKYEWLYTELRPYRNLIQMQVRDGIHFRKQSEFILDVWCTIRDVGFLLGAAANRY